MNIAFSSAPKALHGCFCTYSDARHLHRRSFKLDRLLPGTKNIFADVKTVSSFPEFPANLVRKSGTLSKKSRNAPIGGHKAVELHVARTLLHHWIRGAITGCIGKHTLQRA